MKKKLLMLLGALWMTLTAAQAAAPASYVSFSVNGTTPRIGFDKFSAAVPEPYNLGAVYKMTNEEKPNIGVTGYQVVIGTDREGFEFEDSHYMLAYIGVYDESISISGAYYDQNEDGLFLLPRNASVPVRFGHQFYGGTGSPEPMNETLSASQFVWSDGMVDNFVLPKPLGYDEATDTYKEGEYQKGHSYVIAIKLREVTHMTIGDEDAGWQPGWYYPWPWEPTEYTSWYWKDYSKECLRARFTYAADEAVQAVGVVMTVNGEEKRYNLLGENQDPIDLGTIYKKVVTGVHDEAQWTLPDLGFNTFIVESAVPYTQSEAAGVYGASMTFTTLPKGESDQIDEGFIVDNRDYKTGNFGGFPAILCGTEEGLAKLSENWAYEAWPMDVWTNWLFSGTHPVWAGWANDGQYTFEDGQTYTVAFYFTEYNDNLQPVFIHRNGGKYYKFNFKYSNTTTGIEAVSPHHGSNTYFDLQGRKITSQLRSGVYIVNGKKMIVK